MWDFSTTVSMLPPMPAPGRMPAPWPLPTVRGARVHKVGGRHVWRGSRPVVWRSCVALLLCVLCVLCILPVRPVLCRKLMVCIPRMLCVVRRL